MVIQISTGETTPIEIDGKRYALKSKIDLSLSIQHRLLRLHTRLATMQDDIKRKKTDVAWEKEYEEADNQMVDGICSLFVEAPEELKAKVKKLGVDNRTKIFHVVFPQDDDASAEKKTRGKTTKIIPRLQRFYGGSISEWLELPIGLVNVFIESIQGLRAEENLNNSSTTAVGSGMVKDSQAVRARWERAAQELDHAEGADRQMTKKQFKLVAASMGLGFDG